MTKLHQIIHNPAITRINEQGDLEVDLLQLARFSGAPLTQASIAKLSLMVQRIIRAAFPDAECHVQVLNRIDRSFDELLFKNVDRDQLPKPRKR